MSTSYSPSEMIAVMTAKEIADGEIVFVGIGLPMVGAILAKQTHAKSMKISFESGILGGEPVGAATTVSDGVCCHNAIMFCSTWQTFADLGRGYFDTVLIGGAQIDKFGNSNATAIIGGQSYERPVARLPGSGGANDAGTLGNCKVILVTPLQRRRFPEHVDYITTPGYINGPHKREELGLEGGPAAVITDKCIFRFNKASGEMFLDTLYPGVSVEEIRKEVQWDLDVPKELKLASPPTIQEIELVRKIDPTDIYGLRGTKTFNELSREKWSELLLQGWSYWK
ncbi:MAG: glutaconate CoA-transferase [Nitrososphaerota archaeon]|jgi:glutaconate CoA-transferase subunit B|nr:glutaconate CoA-transferase [Nitrososphaerota archaeon]MDG6921674.1 glutaconate CoA-transferase [Nitrososphaerota archaeon]